MVWNLPRPTGFLWFWKVQSQNVKLWIAWRDPISPNLRHFRDPRCVMSYNPLTPCSLSNQWTQENLTKTVNISPFQAFSPSARQAFHECLTDSEMEIWCFELLETEKSLEVRYVYDCICRFFDFDRPKIIRFFRRQVKRIHILKLKSTGCSPSILIETIQKKMLEQHESISYDPCYIPGFYFLCSFRMDGRHKHSKN